jgi:hypothetical protein
MNPTMQETDHTTGTPDGDAHNTYADRWADVINEVYSEDLHPSDILQPEDLREGESYEEAERRILKRAANVLRNGGPDSFSANELDLVRHMMPAHEVHQSGAVRWVLEMYG